MAFLELNNPWDDAKGKIELHVFTFIGETEESPIYKYELHRQKGRIIAPPWVVATSRKGVTGFYIELSYNLSMETKWDRNLEYQKEIRQGTQSVSCYVDYRFDDDYLITF